MKRVFKLILLFALFAIPEIVNASCDSTELYRLKQIANNVSYKYDYIETKSNDGYSDVTFTITVSNVFDELYVVLAKDDTSDETQKVLLNKSNNEVVVKDIKPGTNQRFEIYASSKSMCLNDKLSSFYVNIPSFNRFYSDTLCDNSKEHEYCKKWVNVRVSKEEFVKELTNYNESKKNEGEIKGEYSPSERKYEDLENLILFLNQYVFYVCIPLIIICIILITYLKNKDNFNLKV